LDEVEFDEFYSASYHRVCGQVYAMIGNVDEAQECTQEAFAKAWAHRRTLDKTGHRQRRTARRRRRHGGLTVALRTPPRTVARHQHVTNTPPTRRQHGANGVAARSGPTRDVKESVMQLTSCPGCAGPAEIVDRHVLESTDGPIEHVQVRCVERHHYFLPAAALGRPH
jgi:DNA-directed RNA polymerase specialized sigma24 family protein